MVAWEGLVEGFCFVSEKISFSGKAVKGRGWGGKEARAVGFQ